VPESAQIPAKHDTGAGVSSFVNEASDSVSDEHGHDEENGQTDDLE
jgi:hypothetical protein